LSHNQELSVNNISKFNSQRVNSHLNARKALSSFYASYGGKSQKFLYQQSLDPLEVITEFYNSAMADNSIEEIYNRLHSTAVTLGYSFTAVGIPDSTNTELSITLTDLTKNVHSLIQSLEDPENIIAKSFNDRTRGHSCCISFPNVDHIENNQCVIIPLVSQDESKGIFIAGAALRDHKNDEIMNSLCTYASLMIANIQLKEKLILNSGIDNLTGLHTHKAFQESLTHSIKKAEKTGEYLSVMIFDINNIARINREFGHAKGDEIIALIAEKIRKNIRARDIAGRFGGDEIAVILPGADNTKACYVAKHINNALSSCCIEGVGHVKASIGVATYPECAKEQEKLLILAEQAMLISKHDSHKNGMAAVVSAQDMNFWNKIALDTLARVIAKRHSQWGVNFEDELVKRFLKSKKMPKIPLDVVSSLAGAIDAKDTYTRGHSQAVSMYAEALARAINLPEKTVQRIKLAALLHDVGKIGITESILRKPGALTDHEWEIMKQHPVIGAKKVLEPIKSLKDLIPIVKHHHERIDGCGYPDRLKDDEIPVGAKIVAIADAFHALISHRPYRKSLTLDRSIEILRAGAGTQWDGELVRKFVTIAPSLCTKP